MRPKPSLLAVLLLLAGLGVLAAGCGGGSKSGSQTSSVSVTLTRTTQSTTSSSEGLGSAPSFASASNCQDMAGIAAKAAAAIESSGNAAGTLQTEASEIQALASSAPSDIRSDFQAVAAAFSSFVHSLQQSGYKIGSKTPPTPAQLAALAKAAKSLDTPKLKQAEAHLSAWARQNCKGVHVGG
jgi:hypothetical protein